MNNSRLILGTVQFGLSYGINNTQGKPSKETVFDILHFAYDQGITQLDSAAAYGDAQHLIGEFSKTTGKKFRINTKFHVNDGTPIHEQLEAALLQLKVEQIHTYFYHRFSDLESAPQTLLELQALKQQGKIANVGISIYTNTELEAAIQMKAVDVIQLPFNLLDNMSKRSVLIEKARREGKQLQIRSVFLQGLFFKHKPFPQRLQPLEIYVDQLKRIATHNSVSMFNLALGYALAKKQLDGIIIGVDSKEQLRDNIEAARIVLNQNIIEEIDEITVKEEELLYPYNWQ
jgi:aryl-alcohol dehydrogenase-like predicted oxidoreductase